MKRCQRCRKRDGSTYALVVDENSGKQNEVLLVCMECKKFLGMFAKPKDR